jgi:ribokinase
MRVHVIGNVAVDETFRVAALPMPGQSVLARARGRDIGGKGANQAIIAARAGVDVRLIAAAGDDEVGDWIRRELAAEGLSVESFANFPGPSDISVVIVGDGGENIVVTTNAAANCLTGVAVESLVGLARAGDILLLQGNLATEATDHVLRWGRGCGLKTVLNPSPVNPKFSELWALLDLAVLNETEALELSGVPDVRSAGRSILAHGARQVVITLGGSGAILFNAHEAIEIPAVPVLPLDTTGAGDTFAGILVAMLARSGEVDSRAIAAAAEAAAITVSRLGTRSAFPTRDEIRAILERHCCA